MTSLTCPIYEAAKHGHEDVLQLLIDHDADINDTIEIRCSDAINPLYKAFEDERYETAKLLITYGANLKKYHIPINSLWNAAAAGEYDAVSYLLMHSCDHIDYWIRDSEYMRITPLMVAIRNGHTSIVKLLLEHDAKYHIEYALEIAIENDAAKVLLERCRKEMDRLQNKMDNLMYKIGQS